MADGLVRGVRKVHAAAASDWEDEVWDDQQEQGWSEGEATELDQDQEGQQGGSAAGIAASGQAQEQQQQGASPRRLQLQDFPSPGAFVKHLVENVYGSCETEDLMLRPGENERQSVDTERGMRGAWGVGADAACYLPLLVAGQEGSPCYTIDTRTGSFEPLWKPEPHPSPCASLTLS